MPPTRLGQISRTILWPVLLLAVVAFAAVITLVVRSPESTEFSAEPPGKVTESAIASDFAGTDRCAECHADKAADHKTSGHSHTFHTVENSPIPALLDGHSYVDPIRGTTLRYAQEGSGVSVRIPEVFGDDLFPLQYALGSGQHAFTFLTLVPGPGGDAVGVEHRVSLYSRTGPDRTEIKGGALGLTPGQNDQQVTEEVAHFGHLVSGSALNDCVRCHTTTAEISGGQIVNLTPNVGCESCHGPGGEHSRKMPAHQTGSSSALSPEIRHLGPMFREKWSAMDEIRLCGQCHRMPEDVPSDRITPYHRSTIRFQPIGLMMSRCFLESEQTLSCSVCHDPHRHSSLTKTVDYEQKCISCHSTGPLNPLNPLNQRTECLISPRKNCVECHMPPIEIHPGVKFHDHWIRVRESGSETAAALKAEAESEVVAPAHSSN